MNKIILSLAVGSMLAAMPASAQITTTGFSLNNSVQTIDSGTRDILSTTTRDVACTGCFESLNQTATASSSGDLTVGTTVADVAVGAPPTANATADPTLGTPGATATSQVTYAEEILNAADFTLSGSVTDTTNQVLGVTTVTSFSGSVFAN